MPEVQNENGEIDLAAGDKAALGGAAMKSRVYYTGRSTKTLEGESIDLSGHEYVIATRDGAQTLLETLDREIQSLLHRYHDDGKEPNPIARGMSWMKTGMKLAWEESDETIADLMTDGCNMGVKSLNKYLNEYEAAEECVKDITKRLINQEERLAVDIRKYL